MLVWLLAATVWVAGLYAASRRCSSLVETLPREGMGVQVGEHGLCEVTGVDGTVVERYDRDDWDATEIALVLAGVGVGILVPGARREESVPQP